MIISYKIVYTSIHGTGLKLISEMFEKLNYKKFHVVKEQAKTDGNFPTVLSPNPEEREAFTIAINQARDLSADLIFGTDPDTDRVGVVIKYGDGYTVLTGNQIGALLTNYMLETNMPITKRHAVINTIVTSDLGHKLAEQAGATTFKTLTGF